MLTDLGIANYQSHRSLRIRLGKLTVITGATGSGKSAVIRAIKMLAFNAKGTSYISQGAKSCRVSLTDDLIELDGMGDTPLTIIIERSRSRGKDRYALELPGDGGLSEFTKLGGNVPGDVSTALRLNELNFSGQFDSPYLLGKSAGDVARTLGELTNVTLLFKAAQEAARRRARLADRKREAERTIDNLKEKQKQFGGLAGRQAAIEEAEDALIHMQSGQEKLDLLQSTLAWLDRAQQDHRARQGAVHDIPDLTPVEESWSRLSHLRAMLSEVEEAQQAGRAQQDAVQYWSAKAAETDSQARELLVAAGRCPLCGSTITEET